ncbi:sensor histidine kinase, partial [Nocardia salmonicida]
MVALTGTGSVAVLVVVTVSRRHRLITAALSLFAVSYLVMCAGWFAAGDGLPVPGTASTWLEGLSIIPALAAAIAWRTRSALVYALVSFTVSRAIHYLNLETVSPRWLVVSVAGNLLLTLVSVVLARIALIAATSLDDSWTRHHHEVAHEAAARARVAESDRMADLLHDYVLGALLAAARQAPSHHIQREAALALYELDSATLDNDVTVVAAHHGAQAILDRCRLSHPDLTVICDETSGVGAHLPATVVNVFAECAREAVRNSYRHCGPHPHVTVCVRIWPDRLEVRVSDDGPGFDAQSPGFGLSRLRERVTALPGATVMIDTAATTMIRMVWSPPALPDTHTESGREAFVDLDINQKWVAVGTFVSAIIASAAAFAGSTTPIAIALVTAAIAIAGAYLLMMCPGDPLPPTPTACLKLGLPAANLLVALTSTSPLSSQIAWPGYLVGSFAMIMGIRGRIVAATVATAGCVAAPLLVAAVSRQHLAYWVAEAIAATMGLALCYIYTSTIRSVMFRLWRLRDQSVLRHADAAARQAGTRQRQQQLSIVELRARPLLEIIASRPLLDVERQHAARLEASLRATLRAPGLRHPDLDDAADRARTQGINVVLIDDSATAPFTA